MKEKIKTFKIGQDTRTGEYVPISVARKNLARYAIVEIPKIVTDKETKKIYKYLNI